jgi:hypothetical protein
MKRIACGFALLVALSTAALAGEIYGKLTVGGKPAEGATVQVKCGSNNYGPATADKSGTYHLVAAATGKCTLTVTHEKLTGSIEIASYDDAAQVDLILEAKDGKLSVRRK